MTFANSIMLRLMAGIRKPCVSMKTSTSFVAARRSVNLNSRSHSSHILPEAAIYRTVSLRRNGMLVDLIDRSMATENPKVRTISEQIRVTSKTKKKKKRKKQQNPSQSPDDHAQTQARSKAAKSATQARSKAAKGRKPKLSVSPPLKRVVNEEGRRILCDSQDDKLIPRCKSIVHEAQTKMLFNVRYDHEMEGPGHKQLFYATLHTTLNEDALEELRSLGIVSIPSRFVNTGSHRSKKRAEVLACIDLIDNLKEYGLDLTEEVPDVANRRREREEAKFKLAVKQAQMLLQAMGITRPLFDTVETGKAGYQSTVSFYCRGEPMCIVDHEGGRSKEEAEGKAILLATRPGGQLEELLINLGLKDRLDRVRHLIDNSPAGHIGTLKIPQLSYEAFDKMDVALDGHEERMDWHAKVKDEYERKFHKRNRGTAEGTSPFQSLAPRGQEDDEEMNRLFQTEEQRRLAKSESDPNGKQAELMSIRDKLPIVAIREQLIDALRSNQCVVVSGGTGSGKSTQCPQYILEDAIASGKGTATKIVVTQPRRIAAISVAERIASERDEEIGRSVGYTVRFNRKAPRSCGSIEFVTTGILLRRLVNDPTLQGVSHVCLDEVHERDIDTDFLLVLLRDLLKSRPDLRVILMSATLDADSFGRYFGNEGGNDVPVMSVPTKPRHPVETIHLEDLARESDEMSSPVGTDREIEYLARSLLELHDQQLQFELEEALAEDAAAKRLDRNAAKRLDGPIIEDSDDSSSDEDEDDSDSDTDSDSDDEEEERQSSRRVRALRKALSMRNAPESSMIGRRRPTAKANKMESEITSKLMSKLASHVARSEIDDGRQGSILCFLPGLDEIKECMRLLEENTDPSLLARIKLIPLHSSIPQSDQQKVFIPAKKGTVKVILATNIAESSVTINDVLAIVDSGLVKEMSYDSEKSLSKMLTVLCSKASATQRLGRAGRVAPGKCYRIYSRAQLSAMRDRPLPEIQRSSLDATCLNTASMTPERVETFLQRAMDPPKEEAVAHSMNRLRKLGAISLNQSSNAEALSPLGVCLSKLPLDPAIGKMLIMGCVMNCLDPVLTAAACISSNDVFYYPPDMRNEVQNVKKEWSDESDLHASVNAYYAFQDFKNKNGWQETRLFSDYNFIGSTAIHSIHSVKSQLLDELTRIGLVPRSDLERHHSRIKTLRHDASVNANADSLSLFTALLSCGLPDNLASKRHGSYQSRVEGNAGIHPSSVLFQPYKSRYGKGQKDDEDRKKTPHWLLYQEMVITSQVFLRRCTALTPLQVVLFGGYQLDGIILDDWIAVNSSCEQTLHLMSVARKEINTALDLRVMDPKNKLPEENQEVLDAVCDTLFDDESFE